MQWHYLINQFLTATRNNFKKAVKLSRYHDFKLQGAMAANPLDPDFALLYNRYHPFHLALEAAYSAWVSSGGAHKGETITFDQLIGLMIGKVKKWDVAVQITYDDTTGRYASIFPQGHKPYYSSDIDMKIAAIRTLSTNIGSDPALGGVKAQVDAYYTQLTGTRGTQEIALGATPIQSRALDDARIDAMNGQYQNLGFLMNKVPDDPTRFKVIFDVETLTHPDQSIWKLHLDALENHPTLIHTFDPTDQLRLKSTGHGGVTAYLASTPGGTDSTPVAVTALHELIFHASDFAVADYSVNRYLTVVNNSATSDTRFVLELY